MSRFEKVVIVTKETQLERLVRKFATKSQAEFYIAQSYLAAAAPRAASAAALKEEEKKIRAGIEEIETADTVYRAAVDSIKKMIPPEVKVQHIDWSYLPGFLFGEKDLVVTLGQDGLVINTAKYLSGQPIFAINPDPARIDGVLLPFGIGEAERQITRILSGDFDAALITIAKASLNDGQELYGVNDIFIGPKSHVSFLCTVSHRDIEEPQSSSGIIVSTGAGSTGWFRSIIEGARQVAAGFDGVQRGEIESAYPWDADYLCFTIREPFPSKTSRCSIVFGRIMPDAPLVITSQMAQNGVIFSDGIENDFLDFNSGKIATISLAERKAILIRK